MAYTPVSKSTALPSASTYKPVSPSLIGSPDAPDESGGFSLLGFLGNVGAEAKGMAQGITSLVGAGLSDVGNFVGDVADFDLGDADYKLDDIAMALPKALADDYNERYGISKFADGDIWGGLKAIFTGLYERPLSAIGDALMVGTGVKLATKAGQAAGIVGEAAAAKVLGPGSTTAMSLTGGGETALKLSQNPVARLGQKALYDAMSYGSGPTDAIASKLGFGGPQSFIEGKVAAGAVDQAIRATSSLAKAAGEPGTTPMAVLRPSYSKLIEKHGVSQILSHMGMGMADRTTRASAAARQVLEPLDDEAREAVTSYAMGTKSPLPNKVPSNASSVHFSPSTQPPDLPDAIGLTTPDGAPLLATEGTSPRMLDAAQKFGRDMEINGEKLPGLERVDVRQRLELSSPHDLRASQRNTVVLATDNMESAYDVAQRYADEVQGRIVAQHNYFQDVNSSYDGIHYFVEDADGAIHDVSVATPELKEAQQAWSHMARDANAKQAEIEGLEAEIKELLREQDFSQIAQLDAEIGRVLDELDALEVVNSQTFNSSRRMMNAAESGGDYDRALYAADRIRNVNFNHASRVELQHGVLTYRKMLDRAYGPLRAEKWSKGMRIIEEHIAIRLQRAMEAGVPKDQWDNIVIDVTEAVLGKNNPWTEKMFHNRFKEIISGETEDIMPAGLGGQPGPLRTRLATGDTNMDPRPYTAPKARAAENQAAADMLEATGDIDEAALADAFYQGASAEIADRLVMRLREATHEALVENGEIAGMTWKDLARESIEAGTPVPQYFPHIKVSKVTGDVAILNQHRTNMSTMLESETGRMKKWGGWLYERGTFERDPIKAYEAMFRQVQRHIEVRDALQKLVDKYGRKVSPEELQAWDLDQHGEVLVSRAGLDGDINSRTKMVTLTHEGVMAGKSIEDATLDALRAVMDDRMKNAAGEIAVNDVWALPKYVAEQMKRRGQLELPGTFNFYYDSMMGMWKSAALSLSPRWVVNNSLGNAVYMGMARPGAIRHFIAQMMPGARARFRARFGDVVLDAVERDFMHGEDLLSSTQRLARRAERQDVGWGARVADSPLQEALPLRKLRGFSAGMRNLNKHIEGAARRGVVIDEVRRVNMTGWADRFLSSKEIMSRTVNSGLDDAVQYDHLISSVNKVLGDYLTMSPVEAQIIRKFLMPFYAFYRHTAKFMARMPFEHPLKVRVLQQIAEVDQQMNPYMPEYMLGAANLLGQNVMFGGANPLEAVSQLYWPQVINPIAALAMQRATATNPFGREWNEPAGGSVTLFGGDRFVIHRDGQGNVVGVQPAGKWQPPLYEAMLGIIPQAGMIFNPFESSRLSRFAGPVTGLSFPKYDPETAQYYAVQKQMDALKAAMRTPPT